VAGGGVFGVEDYFFDRLGKGGLGEQQNDPGKEVACSHSERENGGVVSRRSVIGFSANT
jgi:hypothetical protein